MTHLYADDDYLDHYQFEHDPFLERGVNFKFFAAKRRPVLVELHHLARYSKLMLVVTGPQGSGKTLLRQVLLTSSKEPVKNIVVVAEATVDAASMLQQISTALQLPESHIADVLSHIEQMHMAGQEVHLVVDNAECLDESALLLLQRIAQGVNDACARVFIFSDSSIGPLLERVADNTDLHHVIALEPWDRDEVDEYIEQRLVAAGQGLDVFTEPQLADIFAQSKGWPGRVNHVAKAILLEQMHQQGTGKQATMQIPYKHVAVVAVLAVALLLIWMAQTSESEDTAESAALELSGKHSNQQVLTLPLTEPVLREPLAQALSSEEEGSDYAGSEPVFVDERAVQPIASAPVPVSRSPAEVVKQVVVPQPVAPVEKKPAAVVRQAQPVAKPVSIAKPAPAAARGLSGTAGHSRWYKQQAPARYTLQVFASRTEAIAQRFVKQNTAQYHYFRKEHQGQPLFVVTYGSFADRTAAQAAINRLPENIRKDKPWSRTLLSIQQELR
ncbi:MAG: SPOR domain-containing protein [Pseudomonas sp.]|jgi:DamX protein|nr:SPOR domain-containing protein [Pseudomonas sp.]MDY0413650.1 SPOR domain-containing protein [Pseudomonas sp.]NLO54000.1 AAA family ATPase [Gammaproteobacteria bacterium]